MCICIRWPKYECQQKWGNMRTHGNWWEELKLNEPLPGAGAARPKQWRLCVERWWRSLALGRWNRHRRGLLWRWQTAAGTRRWHWLSCWGRNLDSASVFVRHWTMFSLGGKTKEEVFASLELSAGEFYAFQVLLLSGQDLLTLLLWNNSDSKQEPFILHYKSTIGKWNFSRLFSHSFLNYRNISQKDSTKLGQKNLERASFE